MSTTEKPNLRIYREAMERVWADGIQSADEYSLLETLRKSLKITPEEHLAIESKVKKPQAPTVAPRKLKRVVVPKRKKEVEEDRPPETFDEFLTLAKQLFDEKQYESALTNLDKALELNSNSTEAWTYKGRASLMLDRYEDALKYCDKALALNPDYDDALANKGTTLYALGKHDKAIYCYSKLTENLAVALLDFYGSVLKAKGDYEAALKYYERSNEIKPREEIAKIRNECYEKLSRAKSKS
jgi:tetratricopeptide (TPR) repeat protein